MPRRGEQSARTKAIGDAYKRALKVDGDHLVALRAVASAFDMKTGAVRNTLVRSKVIARNQDDREGPARNYRGLNQYQPSLGTRKAEAAPPPTVRDPCWSCGTRGDIGCRHQPASGLPAPDFVEPPDNRRLNNGQGLQFHVSKLDLDGAMTRLKPHREA